MTAINKLHLDTSTDQLFTILWSKAIKSQAEIKHVYISALTLYKLNIDCLLSPEKAIEQMCIENDWDISIEEVPWYLANQFSKEVILETTKKIAFKTETQNVKLQTIDYWIGKLK